MKPPTKTPADREFCRIVMKQFPIRVELRTCPSCSGMGSIQFCAPTPCPRCFGKGYIVWSAVSFTAWPV